METLKKHIRKVIVHRNTIEEQKRDEKDRGMKIFKYLRPFIIKLFFHSILIFLSIRAYLNFLDSSTAYDAFINTLNEKVVLDIKVQEYSKACENGYSDIDFTYFPQILKGCRCSQYILPANLCMNLKENNVTDSEAQKLKATCVLMDKNLNNSTASASQPNPPPKRSFNDFRNLELDENNEFKVKLPDRCPCFEKFEGININKTIDRFFGDKRICIQLDEQVTTLKYLKSINDKNCSNANRCQNYFCNEKFKSKKCPLVDAYMSYISKPNVTSSSSSNSTSDDTNFSYDRNQLTLVQTTEYKKTFFDSLTLENIVFVPILGMAISRNGKCNIKEDSNLQTDYSAIRNIDCPRDQTYYDFYSQDLKNVLNTNDNYFDLLDKQLPLFSKIVNIDVKWSLALKYSFYRNTIGCLLSKYSNINTNSAFAEYKVPEGYNATRFDQKRFQLSNILSVFIDFTETYTFQNNIQIAILILNCFVIFFNLIIIFYKVFVLCCACPQLIENLAKYEGASSFFLDFVIAVLGGVSYFIIKKFIGLIENLLSTDCIDNRVQYQFGVFNDALDSTAEQNFQIFLFMIFKITIIFFSLLYYMLYKKCNFRWNSIKKVMMETINEGEDEMDLEALNGEEDNNDEEKQESPGAEDNNKDKANNSVQSKNKNDDGKKVVNFINNFNKKKDESDSNKVKDKNPPSQSEMINIMKEVNEEGEIKKNNL